MEKLTYLQKYRKTVTLVDYGEFLNKGLNSLPELWKSFFTSNNEETITKNILYFWKQQIGKKLNNVIAYFEDNLVKVEIIKTNNEFSLLYSIKQENGEILYYEGKFPQTKFNNYKLEKQWHKIPVSIKDFYKNLHNGFYYYANISMGLLPLEKIEALSKYEWRIIDNLIEPLQIDLDSTFTFFTTGIGGYVVIDTNNCFNENATIWFSDEKPMYNKNFWNFVDQWIQIGFEE